MHQLKQIRSHSLPIGNVPELWSMPFSILVKTTPMLPFPQKQILLKPCTHKQLADFYGISGKVLTRWLKPYKEAQRSPKTNYTLTQLIFIVEKIGMPVHPVSGQDKN